MWRNYYGLHRVKMRICVFGIAILRRFTLIISVIDDCPVYVVGHFSYVVRHSDQTPHSLS